MERQLVVFQLANDAYGLDIFSVESIVKIQAIISIPHAPAFMEGVTNLRGNIIPIIDLRKRFNLPAASSDKDQRIIVVDVQNTRIGMIVDSVNEVVHVPSESIDPPPLLSASVDAGLLQGIAKIGERLVLLLDPGKILSTEEKRDLVKIATGPLTQHV